MKWLPLILVITCLSHNSWCQDKPTPGNEGHGGSGIKVEELLDKMQIGENEAIELFDTLEYDKEFTPSELKEFETHLKVPMETLKNILPRTGDYLEKILTRGINPRWYFVKYELKKVIDPSDHSNLIVTFDRVQIALNDGIKVQIQEAFWNKLEPRSRARLIMHEALRSAIGMIFSQPTDVVKSLASLLLHKNLNQFSRKDLSNALLAELKQCNKKSLQSKLYSLVEADAHLENHASDQWQDLTVLSDGVTPGVCTYETDQCVFKDKLRGLKWSRLAPSDQLTSRKSLDAARKSCESMNGWGGENGWRLPTFSELQDARPLLNHLSSRYDAFGDSNSLLWLGSPPLTDPWNPLGITDPEATAGAWLIGLMNGEYRPSIPSAEVSWVCSKNPLSQWQVLSKNGIGEQMTACSSTVDECALKHKSTELIWSEASPNFIPPYSGKKHPGDMGFVSRIYAINACKSLEWLGKKGWRIPSFSEIEQAAHENIYSMALTNESFGSLSGSFWTNAPGPQGQQLNTFDLKTKLSAAKPADLSKVRFICVNSQ